MKKILLSCLLLLSVNRCKLFESTFGTQSEGSNEQVTTKVTDTETGKSNGSGSNTEEVSPVAPSNEETTKKKYQVNFYDYNNALLKGVTVEEGKKPNVKIDTPTRQNEYDPNKNKAYELKFVFSMWVDDKNNGYPSLEDLPLIYADTNYTAFYNYGITGKKIKLYCLDDEYAKTGELKNGPFEQNNAENLVSTIDYTNPDTQINESKVSNSRRLLSTPYYFKTTNSKDGKAYEFCGWSSRIDAKPTDSDLIPHSTILNWTFENFNDGDVFYGIFKQL